MSPAVLRVLRSSLAASVAAYALGLCLASTVTALGAYRVASSVLSSLQAGRGSVQHYEVRASSQAPAAAIGSSHEPPQSPLPKTGALREKLPRLAQAYGSPYWRQRNYTYHYRDPDDDEGYDRDDDDRWTSHRRSSGAYRTLCVRLCDGYYFPVSYSVGRDGFKRDAQTCERACPGQARLFVHSASGEVDDMVDLSGKPYRELKTAFLYRAEYVPSCKCKPDPWDAAAREQHRAYALEAAARKGDAQAKAELAELTAKMKRERPTLDTASLANANRTPASIADAPPRERRRLDADDTTERMGLGGRRELRERPSTSWGRDADWIGRALGRD